MLNDTRNQGSAKLNEKPSVVLSKKAHEKIKFWVDKSHLEISGLGKCKYNKASNRFVVSDVWLLDQTNGAASTDIDAEAAAKLLYETREIEGDLNFWWHSHVNMNVFWSGTDTATIEQLGTHGYCLASVFNKKGEIRSAYYHGGSETVPPSFHDDINTYSASASSQQIKDLEEQLKELRKQEVAGYIEGCQQEYDTKCKPAWQRNNHGGGYYGSTNGGYRKHAKGKHKSQSHTTAGGTNHTGKNGKKPSVIITKSGYVYEDANQLAKTQRRDGLIKPDDLSLRWCSIHKKWIPFNEYFFPVDMNMLDDLGCRLFYATKYKVTLGHPPMDDQDIEEFFMDIHSLTWMQVNHFNTNANYYKIVQKDVAKEITDAMALAQEKKNA